MSVDTEAAFADAVGYLADPGYPCALGVAVSGGGDSMALLHLAARWASTQRFVIHAVTVDHGLRPEAAKEAQVVAAHCSALGLRHSTLRWTGWDGRGNLQDAARQARRRLICDWAKAHFVGAVLLGHTADDQAETVLMRLARGSGVDGLAGMTRNHQPDGVDWHRPLLSFRRADLRQWLLAEKIVWIEDPSNDDLRFDRIKARAMMGHLAALGLSADRLLRTAEHMQLAQVTLRAAALDFAKEHVWQVDGDLVLLPAVFDLTKSDSPGRVLAAALGWMNGSAYRPRYASLFGLADKIKAGLPSTLAGSIAQPHPDGTCRLMRELNAVQPDITVNDDGCSAVRWDKRWLVAPRQLKRSWIAGGKLNEFPRIAVGLRIGALGDVGLLSCPGWRATGIPRASLLASPAVWQGDRLIAAPLAGFNEAWQARIVADFHSWLVSH